MTGRRIAARVVAVAILAVQLGLVVRAYSADHAFFGFQMFPESSEWRADIVRVTEDGRSIDIRAEWPGGYRWEELVSGRGLANPFVRQHADTGVRSTLHFFEEALHWVAMHTPADDETERLVATVETWHNGRGPEVVVIEVRR